MQDDTCVCCGAYVPEGRQVCRKCSGEDKQEQMSREEAEMVLWLSKATAKEVSREMRKTEKKLFGRVLA